MGPLSRSTDLAAPEVRTEVPGPLEDRAARDDDRRRPDDVGLEESLEDAPVDNPPAWLQGRNVEPSEGGRCLLEAPLPHIFGVVDVLEIGEDDVDIVMSSQNPHNGGELARLPQVVRVEEGHDLAPRGGDARLAGRTDPTVGF